MTIGLGGGSGARGGDGAFGWVGEMRGRMFGVFGTFFTTGMEGGSVMVRTVGGGGSGTLSGGDTMAVDGG